jgi:hypothetical protein
MHFRSEQSESAAKDTSDRRVDGNAPAIVCEPAIQSTTILPLFLTVIPDRYIETSGGWLFVPCQPGRL